MQGEIEIIRGIQSVFSTPFAQGFVVFCARWMIFVFAGLAALTSFSKRRQSLRHAAYEAAWAGLLALVVALLLGIAIGRVRPFAASSEVLRLIPPPASTYSFPSGHTSVAFAIAAALAYGDISLGLLAFGVAWFVAFGRIAAGVHYPSDILAGIVVGFICFALVRFFHRALRRKDLKKVDLPKT